MNSQVRNSLIRWRLVTSSSFRNKKKVVLWAAAVVLSALLLVPIAAQARGGQKWFSAWSTSHNIRLTSPELSGATVRMIVRPTISGSHLRVKLENTMGESAVVFSAAYIGAVESGAALVEGSNKQLTFEGSTSLTLAAGADAYSDPIRFDVDAFERLAVSLDVASAADVSAHQVGLTRNFMGPGGTASASGAEGFVPVPEILPLNAGNLPFYWVAAVDVQSPSTTGTVVLFGDSITDGRCSTKAGGAPGIVAPDDLYQRWGDSLAGRLAALPRNQQKAIANAGIAGNGILTRLNGPSALERLDRDVLDRAGVTHVVFFEGTNDVRSGNASAAAVIAGTQQIIDRVHAKGLEIIGATMIPRASPRGFTPSTVWNRLREETRVAVNDWIRTEANFDSVIDFASLLSGPVVELNDGSFAETIPPEWNCGDYIHPNAAGYAAMGEYVETALFENVGSWGNGPR
jgi:lysophospholipase L1-like esterase